MIFVLNIIGKVSKKLYGYCILRLFSAFLRVRRIRVKWMK